ncbi:MAG: (d)CMP kinase [Flavobacteriaceae bacterium]|nr:cytidylate kinase [Flavobacteriaceae bacterium]|tara:strand:- start:1124 stop:1810 length:687 start_codon:yes stop_codon:yes gene_type:complete
MPGNIISVDGFSSTGKSTLASKLAEHYNFYYLNSGLMYRIISYFALNNGFILKDKIKEFQLINKLDNLNFDWMIDNKGNKYLSFDGKIFGEEVFSFEISDVVSSVAKLESVRKILFTQQKNLAIEKSIVVEGRDIGTVVFPEAKVKFFLTADLDIRTIRRNKQIEENNISFDTMKVEENLIKRDKTDSERKIAPLKKAKDAYEIDTSKKSQLEVFDIAISYIDSNFKF